MDEPEVSIDDASYRSLSLDMGEPDKRLRRVRQDQFNATGKSGSLPTPGL